MAGSAFRIHPGLLGTGGVAMSFESLAPAQDLRMGLVMSTLGIILLIVLLLALIGALPTWGHSKNWGYAPTGGLGLVLLIVIILLLLGKI
jgi:hypothetical protein